MDGHNSTVPSVRGFLLDKKVFLVNDLNQVKLEFYQNYNPEYWLYKISSLWDLHNNLEQLNLKYDPEEYRRTLRTEMHFLYFKMVEAVFQIIFALSKFNKNLWIALTFANDRRSHFYVETYARIRSLTNAIENEKFFNQTIKLTTGEELPILHWIFFGTYKDNEKDLLIIRKLLTIFARDFSDLSQYNAYKHSLRIYNNPAQGLIGAEGSPEVYTFMQSEDSIIYLREWKKERENKEQYKISKVIKTFNFKRDYLCCMAIYELISNAVNYRKYSLLPELKGRKYRLFLFSNKNIEEYFSDPGRLEVTI